MDPPPALTSTPHRDKTFRNYTPSDAVAYAANRLAYPAELISTILNTHTSTGGKLDMLLDVGCGPGLATRDLSPHFQSATGTDPGEAMITTAGTITSTTASGEPVTYIVCSAEDLASHFPAESVDLITAATAAHWFDMPHFYVAASQILRSGGSIAIWCHGRYFANPATTPNVVKIQAIFSDLEDNVLAPYQAEGNRMCQDLYRGLALPWTVPEPRPDGLEVFNETSFMRKTWNENGYLESGHDQFLHGGKYTLEQSKRALGTASQVTRWREANRDKVENGEVEDCIEKVFREIREAMDETDDGKGRDWVESGSALVLMVIKKKI